VQWRTTQSINKRFVLVTEDIKEYETVTEDEEELPPAKVKSPIKIDGRKPDAKKTDKGKGVKKGQASLLSFFGKK
jgi:hypothetical protein